MNDTDSAKLVYINVLKRTPIGNGTVNMFNLIDNYLSKVDANPLQYNTFFTHTKSESLYCLGQKTDEDKRQNKISVRLTAKSTKEYASFGVPSRGRNNRSSRSSPTLNDNISICDTRDNLAVHAANKSTQVSEDPSSKGSHGGRSTTHKGLGRQTSSYTLTKDVRVQEDWVSNMENNVNENSCHHKNSPLVDKSKGLTSDVEISEPDQGRARRSPDSPEVQGDTVQTARRKGNMPVVSEDTNCQHAMETAELWSPQEEGPSQKKKSLYETRPACEKLPVVYNAMGKWSVSDSANQCDEAKREEYISVSARVISPKASMSVRANNKRPEMENRNNRKAEESKTSFTEKQPNFKQCPKTDQGRSVILDALPEMSTNKVLSPEIENLRKLHASIASKSGPEFCDDMRKRECLQFVEGVVVDVGVLPHLVHIQDRQFWEVWRLGTFSYVEELAVFAIRLAQSGFYYDSELKDIRCFSCGLVKGDWEKSEKIALVHLQLSPHCQHANFTDDRNVPISSGCYPLLKSSEESDTSRNDSDGTENGRKGRDRTTTMQSPKTGSGTVPSVNSEPVRTTNGHGNLSDDGNESVPTVHDQAMPTVSNGESVVTDGDTGPVSTNEGPVTITEAATATDRKAFTPATGPAGTAGNTPTHSFGASGAPTAPPTPLDDGTTARTAGDSLNQQNSGAAVSVTESGPQSDSDDPDLLEQTWARVQVTMRRAACPSQASVAARLRSFLGWPATRFPRPRSLVLAGFYFSGTGDSVQCFFCGVTIRNWAEDDDPWAVHVRFRFSCDYVKAIKGEDFVYDALLQMAKQRGRVPAQNGEQSSPSPGTSQSLPASSATRTCSAPAASQASLPAPRSGADAQVSTDRAQSAAARASENLSHNCSAAESDNAARNGGVSNQTETGRNAANQNTAGRAASHANRPTLPSTNQNSVNTSSTESTTDASRNSQASLLQCDSEPSTVQQHVPPSSAAAPQNIRRSRLTVTPVGSEASRGRSVTSSAGRLAGTDGNEEARLRQLQEDNRRLRERLTCRVCGARNADTLFLPCGHLCTCESCAPSVHFCCLCHDRVRATARVVLE